MMNSQTFPIYAMCHVPKPPVEGATVTSAQVTLTGQLDVYADHVVLRVADPVVGAIACQTIAIPAPPPLPEPESDAAILRRIADTLDRPEWEEYDDGWGDNDDD